MPQRRPSLTRRRFVQGTAVATAALAARSSDAAPASGGEFRSPWHDSPDRPWLGADVWANPLQDWRVANGRAECTNAAADRNIHALTRQLAARAGDVRMAVRVGRAGGGPLAGKGSFGFRLGILGTLREYPEHHDYRNNLWPAPGSGFNAGVTADGGLFVGALADAAKVKLDLAREEVDLRLVAEPKGGDYAVTLTALDAKSGQPLAQATGSVPAEQLIGNVALVCNFPGPGAGQNAKGKAKAKEKSTPTGPNPGLGQFWFSDWRISGSKFSVGESHTFGPILWTQYTLSDGVLKLTAQMPPLAAEDEQTVRLQVQRGGAWQTVGEEKIHPQARTATFRLAKWDDTQNTPYRVSYRLKTKSGGTEHHWPGTIRRDPVDQAELSVADISCNIHSIFPNAPLVRSAAKLNPDLLAFTGDQFYESCGGYGVQRAPLEPAILDYLRKWFFHGWTWRELMRDRPSVSIPDDHDIYQGNLWGEGGLGRTTTQEAGGYDMPAEWVNVVHRTQTSHHPDAYDPVPGARGTTNWFGALTYGRVSFALLADRQYKSGPEGKVPPTGGPRGDHVKDENFNPKTADVPGLHLLGAKQEQFLREWALDWRGAELKAVISQTVFTAMATTHGGVGRLIADYDTNAWPQTARNRAVRELRRCFAFHLAGDQHLPALIHYGIEAHQDAGVAFAGPAVNVGYPRWWEPDAKTNARKAGQGLLGDFRDHFGHPLTVLAVNNMPAELPKGALDNVHAKTSGLGVVRFNKAKRQITIECWPYLADVTKPGTQMPGWPVTMDVLANYGRKAVAHLPALNVTGAKNPVVQVLDEAGKEVIYSLRVPASGFRPPVFAPGKYTVRVTEPETGKTKELKGVAATQTAGPALTVSL
jgi:alkaline phosphatase D